MIVTQIQDLVYLPSLLLPLLHISPAQCAVFGGSLPEATLVDACKHTVACSTLEYFSSTAGVRSGFGEAEPMVVGGKCTRLRFIRGQRTSKEGQAKRESDYELHSALVA